MREMTVRTVMLEFMTSEKEQNASPQKSSASRHSIRPRQALTTSMRTSPTEKTNALHANETRWLKACKMSMRTQTDCALCATFFHLSSVRESARTICYASLSACTSGALAFEIVSASKIIRLTKIHGCRFRARTKLLVNNQHIEAHMLMTKYKSQTTHTHVSPIAARVHWLVRACSVWSSLAAVVTCHNKIR